MYTRRRVGDRFEGEVGQGGVLREVAALHVASVWPFAREWVQTAMEHGDGEWDEKCLRDRLDCGNLRLLLAIEGVVRGVLVCQICDGPKQREAHVLYAAGPSFTLDKDWVEKELVEWAKANRAEVLQAFARPAVSRLLSANGWKETYRVVRKRL